MDVHFSRSVRAAHADKGPRALLESPISVLVGVDAADVEVLSALNVETVHDLATNHVFVAARAVAETVASGGPSGSTATLNASEALADSDGDNLAALATKTPDALEGVDEETAGRLAEETGLRTVQDLSRWPPFLAARSVLGELTGEGAETVDGVPKELVPTARKYATEQSFYTKVFLDERIDELGKTASDTSNGTNVLRHDERESTEDSREDTGRTDGGSDREEDDEDGNNRIARRRKRDLDISADRVRRRTSKERASDSEHDARAVRTGGDDPNFTGRLNERVTRADPDTEHAGDIKEREDEAATDRTETDAWERDAAALDEKRLARKPQLEETIRPEFLDRVEERLEPIRPIDPIPLDDLVFSPPDDSEPSTDAQIDIAAHDPVSAGFEMPAVGAMVQFSQTWVPQGLSLGQLLHSTTLAPGESTKVAVIDWSRRVRAEHDEAVDQTERLDAETAQNRSIEEVQEGVVNEVQHGSSMVSSDSTTTQSGDASNWSLFGIGTSSSSGESSTVSNTTTVSTSSGRRAVDASMVQNIRHSTQQHASSARTRRASVVRETEQTESEQVKTRVITNYNHMHALSVHYYEVVQIFRVEVGPEDAQPVLFVPFKVLDFSDRRLVLRYRSALRAVALDEHTRELIDEATGYVTLDLHDMLAGRSSTEKALESIGGEPTDADDRWAVPGETQLSTFEVESPVHDVSEFRVYRRGEDNPIRIGPKDGAVDHPLRIEDVERIEAEIDAGDEDDIEAAAEAWAEQVSPTLPYVANPVFDRLSFSISVERPDGRTASVGGSIHQPTDGQTIDVLEVSRTDALDELVRRLQEERLYYSQAIWERLDAQTAALLLGGFEIDGRSAIEYVDPTPVATHGNYVAFPLSVPQEPASGGDPTFEVLAKWWDGWRERNFDPTRVETDLVPLPSGGVYGEAVLGRANAAEKLDLTRFWDWQESPIPHQAPEISPVSTGSRATDEDISPGSLDQPVVQVQTPPSLPQPSGVDSVLSALTASNVFRDMSGLDAAAQLAQHGQSVTGEGATDAANTASETFQAASEAQNQALSTIADLIVAMSDDGGVGGGDASTSELGAMYNEASALDSGSGSGDGSGMAEQLLLAAATGGTGVPLGGADAPGAMDVNTGLDGGTSPSGPQPPLDAEAGREFQLARHEMGPWTWRARRLWILTERAKTRRFPGEPETNVDQLPIPPWFDADQWEAAVRERYERQHQELLEEDPDTDYSREPENILGDMSEPVEAQYFVIHDPDTPGENIDGSDNEATVHLWLGVDNLDLEYDWHVTGNATKLERGRAGCFLHTEVCHADGENRDPGTGIHALHQYMDLAHAYVATSVRAGRFLTVTGHVELDRGIDDGHSDPVDFNLELFYAMVSQSLQLGDADESADGLGLAATFGIEPERIDTDNRAGEVNEFIPYITGEIPAANQYGSIRQRPGREEGVGEDVYESYDREHHFPGRWGWLYDRDQLPGNRQCGGGEWHAGASAPPIPDAAKDYIELANEDDKSDDGGLWV